MSVAKVKRAVRDRDGNKCVDCDLNNFDHLVIFGRGLHVHRLVPESPYTVEGCVTLCTPCHAMRHGATVFTRHPAGLRTKKSPKTSVVIKMRDSDLKNIETIISHLEKIGGHRPGRPRSHAVIMALHVMASWISRRKAKHPAF